MERKFKNLTEIIPELKDDGNNIFIKEVKIFKSKDQSVIEIFSDEKISDELLDFIKTKIEEKVNEIKINIEVLENEEILNENELRKFISKEFNIKEFNFLLKVVDNIAKVHFYVQVDEEKVENLKNECKRFGLTLDYKINGNSNNINKFIDHIEDEENEIGKKATVENIPKKALVKIEKSNDDVFVYRKRPKKEYPNIKLNEIKNESGYALVRGKIFNIDEFEFTDKSGNEKMIISIYFSDETDSTYTKVFLSKEDGEHLTKTIKPGMGIEIIGEISYDTYMSSPYIKPTFFEPYNIKPRSDNSLEKRSELHLHTNMSAQDGISSPEELINRAEYWGFKGIAITDHSVVQAFPEAMNASKGKDIKVIYGSELYLVDDEEDIIKNSEFIDKDKDSFVVFDVETTGFSARNDMIIEIGAVKIKNGEIIDNFNMLINPERSLKTEIINLTGITDSMLVDKPKFSDIKDEFFNFIKDSILVAHNAPFDMGFLKENFQRENMEFNFPYIDTLELSRIFYPNVKSHKLGKVAKRLGVSLENAHRAVDDAKATGEVFLRLLNDEIVKNDFRKTLKNIQDLKTKREKNQGKSYHCVVLAKNLKGLKNLYKIISKAHIDYFYYTPRIPKSVLENYRDGLILGSACQDGELQQGIIRNINENKLLEIADYYDYLEIQPVDNNLNLIPEYFNSKEELRDINKKILKIGDRLNKKVVATGDVHYLDTDLYKSRNILKTTENTKFDEYKNPYHFRTTEEMLEEFSYLGDRTKEVVIDNSNFITDMIEDFDPIPSGTFPPKIEGSDENLRKMTMDKAHEIYGDELPKLIEDRINVELDSIIKNGYSELYIIAQKLVFRSNEDGYEVGSRGSVGSSLVATLCGITEVNPLPPHYSCPNCRYNEFIDTQKTKIFSGHDLPEKKCPKCNTDMNRLGDEIPFEVFLGFDGDKEPDIDLNFAGEYQPTAHKYTEELFGDGKVFRAGTIGTIAEKTAIGYVRGFMEDTNTPLSRSEVMKLASTLVGVKRTTGQHAGGMMIVPDYKDIYDFTPIQKPANKKESETITTHYDYNAISENILKLDILGHDVPTMIKMIEEFTGDDFMKTPLNDKNVLSIFSSSDVFKLNTDIYYDDIGTLGIPEFGTNFVKRMLKMTKPSTFAELVRISGLSHGTNVWTGNAEELVKSGQAELKEVISTREDIMQDLINAGAEKKFSFNTMEKVRKGKGLTPEEEKFISTLDLPDWYIDSLNKISYMFPKAHAVAYVSMSVRLAYYKVYKPEVFYATFLSTKVSNFDYETIIKGPEAIKLKVNMIKSEENLSKNDKDNLAIYDMALEIYARGLEFGEIDINKARATKFNIYDGKIIPPFTAVPNLGDSVANAIVEKRNEEGFLSIEDLQSKTKLSNKCADYLKEIGALNGLSDSNQLSLF